MKVFFDRNEEGSPLSFVCFVLLLLHKKDSSYDKNWVLRGRKREKRGKKEEREEDNEENEENEEREEENN